MSLFKINVKNKLLAFENEAKYSQQVNNRNFKQKVVS